MSGYLTAVPWFAGTGAGCAGEVCGEPGGGGVSMTWPKGAKARAQRGEVVRVVGGTGMVGGILGDGAGGGGVAGDTRGGWLYCGGRVGLV